MLNEMQKKVVNTIEGPVLVIAGPGTGKTHTIVERVSKMILNDGISPSEIMVSTFTTKAHYELVSRLSDRLRKKDGIDVGDLLIGNFHSIAREIIDKYIEHTPLQEGYTTIDENEQEYLIRRNIDRFKSIKGFDYIMEGYNLEKKIVEISSFMNENLVKEVQVEDSLVQILYDISDTYKILLKEKNLLDFSMTLKYCYDLLNNNKEVLREVQKRTKYILIDEYQDTNRIQEAIILLLAGEDENICVVGDDDQGLYRFRGASVQNLLEFEKKVKKPVEKIYLVENYRSDGRIIEFYNNFMGNKKLIDFSNYRFDKSIVSSDKKKYNEFAVGKIISDDIDSWCKNTFDFVTFLINNKVLKDYNQVAILFTSINDPRALSLKSYFKKHGVGVYTPKESSLLSKKEIRELIGALLYIFRDEIDKLQMQRDFKPYLPFYRDCVIKFKKYINEEFLLFAKEKNKEEIFINDLIYELFQFEPFKTYLADEDNLACAQNLSRFIELINSEEKIDGKKENKSIFAKIFFIDFLGFMKDQRVKEFENDTDFPNEGEISFLTIHMSKGMEYPLVIVSSLWDYPWKRYKKTRLESGYDRVVQLGLSKADSEPDDLMSKFDFFRKYYTAFSRAKDMLVFSGIGDKSNISYIFKEILENVNYISKEGIKTIDFSDVKNSEVLKSYAYTSHINLYRICPRKYKFFKIMNFKDKTTKSIEFGNLVHRSFEDINNLLAKKEKSIKEVLDLVEEIVFNNASFMESTFTKEEISSAKEEIKRYLSNYEQIARESKYAEFGLMKAMDGYILKGNIDLVSGDSIIDFKTGRNPFGDVPNEYIEQLAVYEYLYKNFTGKENIKTALYYTRKDNENLYPVDFKEGDIKNIISSISDTVIKIENKEFSEMTSDIKNCKNCSMRFYCFGNILDKG